MTAMINHICVSFSRFKYMNFDIFTCILHLLRVYYELTRCAAPSGLIAQLVEHCTGIAEVPLHTATAPAVQVAVKN